MKKPESAKPNGAVTDDRVAALMSKIKQEDVPERLLELARELQIAIDGKRGN
ncbi:hypothetical protein [Rhizobium sp. SG2393]|uniref:hypothetical protein n=1 Tax=Rhizobium sp. SG2393 TaxID=3276279 RepID=UPI003671B818